MESAISAISILLLAYVLGSIPTGYWVAKSVKGIDIRTCGSGSTGATNVWRCVGKAAGTFVFFVDVFKGYIVACIAVNMDNGAFLSSFTGLSPQTLPTPGTAPYQIWEPGIYPHLIPALVAVMALVGHSKSIFLNFTGGKSAATGLGSLFGLNPLGGFFTFITWISLVRLTKIVSVASLTAVALCPFFFAYLHAPIAFIAYCVVGFIYVSFRHRSNIKRLMNGTEPKLGEGPKN